MFLMYSGKLEGLVKIMPILAIYALIATAIFGGGYGDKS
jgi:hypothetical protein